MKGLESGADDFLTKPVSEVALVTRVKSLLRLKMVTDELELRAAAMQSVGLNAAATIDGSAAIAGRILVVDDRENSTGRIRQALQRPFEVEITGDPAEAIDARGKPRFRSDHDQPVAARRATGCGSARRSRRSTGCARRRSLLITDANETQMVMRALDLGVNDYIIRPIDANELRARVRTQLRRKLYQDRLRNMVTQAVEFAITDPLTGLYNRRYLDAHLKSALARADDDGEAGLRADLRHRPLQGHQRHLRARRRRRRAEGLRRAAAAWACAASTSSSRYGGEEFLLVMPDTDADYAASVAERLRSDVEKVPFATKSGRRDPGDGQHRHRRMAGPFRHAGRAHQARRPGALSRPSAPAATGWSPAPPERAASPNCCNFPLQF